MISGYPVNCCILSFTISLLQVFERSLPVINGNLRFSWSKTSTTRIELDDINVVSSMTLSASADRCKAVVNAILFTSIYSPDILIVSTELPQLSAKLNLLITSD